MYHYDYDEHGSVIVIGFPNKISASFMYDDNGRIQQGVTLLPDGTTLMKETCSYDANNNRVKMIDQEGNTTTYAFDEQDQLVRETHPKTKETMEYVYDAVGNRIKKITRDNEGNLLTDVSYVYNQANQLVKVGKERYTYDLRGNLMEDEDKKYTWDEAGRLIEVYEKESNNVLHTFVYDEMGRRVQATVDGKVTHFVYDGNSMDVLYETNENNEVTCFYTRSATGQLLGMQKDGKYYTFHSNVHGDVVKVTDKNGHVVASYVYDAWGNIVEETGVFVSENPYRYAGYRYDERLGLYYLTARYYNPVNGNFLSLDPNPGELEDLQSQNGYSYVGNNPVMHDDPTGEHPLLIIAFAAWTAYDLYDCYKRDDYVGMGITAGMCVLPVGKVVQGGKWVVQKVGQHGRKIQAFGRNLFRKTPPKKGAKPQVTPTKVGSHAVKGKGNAKKNAPRKGKPPVKKAKGTSKSAVTIKKQEGNKGVSSTKKKVPAKSTSVKTKSCSSIKGEKPVGRAKKERAPQETRPNHPLDEIQKTMSPQESRVLKHFQYKIQKKHTPYVSHEGVYDRLRKDGIPRTLSDRQVKALNQADVKMMGKKRDIKQIESISKEYKMTNQQRREFGDYIESLKDLVPNNKNFPYEKLKKLAKEFMGELG